MIDLAHVILTNGAGEVKTYEDARKLLNSSVTRITIGSIKLEPWPGNSGETYYYHPERKTAWNSKGLNNPGIHAVLEWLPRFHDECVAAGKELAVSIAGSTPEEYAELARLVSPYCDIIEVNAGCGNVWGPEGQKPVPSYHPQLLDEILERIECTIGRAPRVTVKISPVPNDLVDELALVLDTHECVAEAICCNTKILQHARRPDGSQALTFVEPGGSERKHVGGMSGRELKPDSMRVLGRLLARAPRLRFLGCGGIAEGQDLLDYLDLGATGGAIATEFFEKGPRIFYDVAAEAEELVAERLM